MRKGSKLSKRYQVIDILTDQVWRVSRTRKDCLEFLRTVVIQKRIGVVALTIRPIWTNHI